jgi:hypothetical protein
MQIYLNSEKFVQHVTRYTKKNADCEKSTDLRDSTNIDLRDSTNIPLITHILTKNKIYWTIAVSMELMQSQKKSSNKVTYR